MRHQWAGRRCLLFMLRAGIRAKHQGLWSPQAQTCKVVNKQLPVLLHIQAPRIRPGHLMTLVACGYAHSVTEFPLLCIFFSQFFVQAPVPHHVGSLYNTAYFSNCCHSTKKIKTQQNPLPVWVYHDHKAPYLKATNTLSCQTTKTDPLINLSFLYSVLFT